MKNILLISAFTVVIFFGFGCEKANQAPVIDSLYASPDSVFPGDTVLLRGFATELDGETILFEWSFRQSVLENPSWIAPLKPGDYFITLKASDGILTVQDSLMVHVKDTIGTFVDPRDQHEYHWVKIGQQIWMAENLAYFGVLGKVDQYMPDKPFCSVYGYQGTYPSEAMKLDTYSNYGVLFNNLGAKFWCPPGWHLPSDTEWTALELNLGVEVVDTAAEYRYSGNVGYILKSSSFWIDDGQGDNSVGFDARPGGLRSEVGFQMEGQRGYFWSSTITDQTTAWFRELSYRGGYIRRFNAPMEFGFSVRCIKD